MTTPQSSKLLSKYPTFVAFASAFSPDITIQCARQPEHCITADSPSLATIARTYGDMTADVKWLMVHLAVFEQSVNVSSKMTIAQREACARAIASNFFFLKASEIILFFANLQGGLYDVDWYGSITPDKIIKALRDHFMPYRRSILVKHHESLQEEKERKSMQGCMTWKEYCKMKNINKESPLSRLESCGEK